MKNYVLTEVDLPLKLQRFGFFHHLEVDDVQFHIPDWIYYETQPDLAFADRDLARSMVEQEKIKLLSLNGDQFDQVLDLHEGCCSMFLARTASALVFARSEGYTLVSESQPLRIISYQQLGISISRYESVAVGLLQDIVSRGIHLEIELFRELI